MGSMNLPPQIAQRRQDRRDQFVSRRERELLEALSHRPLQACVDSLFSDERGAVPVAVDLAGWVNESAFDGDRTLAEAIFSTSARERLFRRYANARARLEADLLPADYFGAVAA